jgi:peptidoglycan/LPS O-acetylase OafA/YrhL
MSGKSERAIQLDVVRGLAILLAIGWHLSVYTGNGAFDVLMVPGRTIGWAGVDLFFVLSGFLVGRLILVELRDTGSFNYRRFLIRRIFRLWPVLYVFIVAEAILGKSWKTFVFQIFFHVQNYFVTPISHLWSLAVEEQFYLIAGLVLPIMAARRVRPATYLKALIAIMVGCLALRIVGASMGVGRLPLQYQTQFRADSLACGVALAVLNVHYRPIFDRFCRPKLVLTATGLIGFIMLAPMGIGVIHSTIGYTVAYLASACVLLAAYDWHYPNWTAPFIKAVAFLGLYSYSIYIWHFAAGHSLETLAQHHHVNDPIALVIIGYVAAILVAFVVARGIEMPMISLRDRLFPRMGHDGKPVGGEDLPTGADIASTRDCAATTLYQR